MCFNLLNNKPERVFGLQLRCRELDIFKIFFWEIYRIFFWFFGRFFCNFLGIFWKFLGEFFRGFEGCFLRKFLGKIFWKDFFGRNLLWGFFCEELFVELFFVFQDFGFCQDFVSMHKDKKFRSLEVQEASSSHLKRFNS